MKPELLPFLQPSKRIYSNHFLILQALEDKIRSHEIRARSARRRGNQTKAEDHEILAYEYGSAQSWLLNNRE